MNEHEQLTEEEKELLQTPISHLMKLGRVRSGLDAVEKKFTLNRKENEAHNDQ